MCSKMYKDEMDMTLTMKIVLVFTVIVLISAVVMCVVSFTKSAQLCSSNNMQYVTNFNTQYCVDSEGTAYEIVNSPWTGLPTAMMDMEL